MRVNILLLLLTCVGKIVAQFSIAQIRTPVIPVDVRAIAMGDSIIYAAGSLAGQQSVIAKSSDGGNTWQRLDWNFSADDNLTALSFPTAAVGYAGGSKGIVYKTTDTGLTWERCADTSHYRGNITQLHFFTPDSGYLCGSVNNNAVLFKTTDGGAYWQAVNTPVNNTPNAMHWDNMNNGILVGAASKIMRTTNGGLNWQVMTPGSKELYAITRVSPSTFFIAGNGVLYKSTDNGSSFVQNSPPENVIYYSMCFRDSLRGCLSGQNGKIFTTTDGGNSWILKSSISGEDIRCARFTGNGLMLGASGGSIIKLSSDFSDWANATQDSRTYHAVTVQNGAITIAGEKGNIRTSNSNVSQWLNTAHTSTLGTFTAVDRKGSSIYATGQGGLFFLSTDEGNTWAGKQVILSGAAGSGISFIDANRGFISGIDGSIYYTSDKGQSWIKRSIAVSELYGIKMLNETFGVVIGSEKKIYTTTDFGINWQAFPGTPPAERLHGLCLVNHLLGYVSGENGTVYKTTDGFQSLSIVSDTVGLSGKTIYSVAAINDSLVFAVGRSGCILGTGANKRLQLFDSTGSDLMAAAVYDAYSVVATGAGGKVYRIGLRVIPVEDYPCSVQFVAGMVELKWEVTSGKSLRGFHPQFSINGIEWIAESFLPVGKTERAELSIYKYLFKASPEIIKYCRIGAIDFEGNTTYSNPVTVENIWEHTFRLFGNFPNPCNASTNIQYSLSRTAQVRISMFNLVGEKLLDIVKGMENPGKYSVHLDLRPFASGIYYYRLSADEQFFNGKIVLLK
ncbi:MAG: T9SS type A sorting domain-containing protein [Ignavibacteriales bacterium]|nr:T9SS type A sorting domain-containing protein [Ignavibacteriales bacterium]